MAQVAAPRLQKASGVLQWPNFSHEQREKLHPKKRPIQELRYGFSSVALLECPDFAMNLAATLVADEKIQLTTADDFRASRTEVAGEFASSKDVRLWGVACAVRKSHHGRVTLFLCRSH